MIRLAVSFLALALSCAAWPQSLDRQTPNPPGPAVAKLSPPVYPQSARNAGVSGDVVVAVTLQSNGAVDTVSVVSGPAILREAAIESARQTQFDCSHCVTGPARLELTYRFVLGTGPDCAGKGNALADSSPRVTESGNTIRVESRSSANCDSAASIDTVRSRSLHCLFLWRCGWSKMGH